MQIVEQHPPRNAIDHQVVNDHQQTLLTLRTIDQQGAQQRAVLQVEAALGVGVQRGTFGHVGDLRLYQQGFCRHCTVFSLPFAVLPGEAQAQGVMLFEQCTQCLLQQTRVECSERLQHQRLVPVLTLGNRRVEEPVLDRRQRGCALQ